MGRKTIVMNEKNIQPQPSAMEFIKLLYNLIYTARIHKDNNKLLRESLGKFKGILDDMTKENDLEIKIWRERFHFGGEKLRHGRENFHVINEMIKYFANRNIGKIEFLTTSGDASPKDIMILIRLLDVSIKSEAPLEWINSKLVEYSISWAKVYEKTDKDGNASVDSEDTKRHERARNAYLLALDTVKEVADKASKGVAGVLKARRLAQSIVDLVHEDRSLMLGLATLQEYDDYTYTHSVNVSLLATCLGKQIGLSKVVLEHLTVCGLFHDLGKVGVPRDILLKKGRLNEDEWETMQTHPMIGVKKILRLNADKELRSKIILGPFEHHLNPDMTGYPKTHFMKNLSLSGRILRIVDVYEALTANRAYRSRSFTPDEALRRMWSEGEKSFDRILLKSFIQMMGIFPIGSIVELNNGRFAMIMDYPDGPMASPTAMLLDGNIDDGVSRGEVISLMGKTDKSGSPELGIARGVLPSRIGVSVAELLLIEK